MLYEVMNGINLSLRNQQNSWAKAVPKQASKYADWWENGLLLIHSEPIVFGQYFQFIL